MSGDVVLSLKRVSKRFGAFVAVDEVSFDVCRGEFITLLGPSGCGKTTILRMVAGFEHPDGGEIRIGGRSMRDVPAYEREIGLVFQNLALFPHLDVGRNVAFGLRLRKLPTAEIEARVSEVLELVGLSGFARRPTGKLSGGQRQRVALARSLVVRPALLLLDEPLSALDLKLRRQLQIELKRIQQQTRTTFIFVTHDQEEALSMSDRIAVMNQGRLEQFSSAVDTYHRPCTEFVARFVGDTNLIDATVRRVTGDGVEVSVGGQSGPIVVPRHSGTQVQPSQRVRLSLRPEALLLGEEALAARVRMAGELAAIDFCGAAATYRIDSGAASYIVRRPFVPLAAGAPKVGDRVPFGWNGESAVVVPCED